MTKPDPYTHRHSPSDMKRSDNGSSECRACGRRWFLWERPNGGVMLLTEPRFNVVRSSKPQKKPKDEYEDEYYE